MTRNELLKIINYTDEEIRLSLEKIEVDLESIIKSLKKTDYFDTDYFDSDDLMNGVNKDNAK